MKRLSRLSALLFAAAMALAPASAFAQSYTYSPSQSGAVGSVVSATDPGGGTRKVVLPNVQCTNCSGGGGSTLPFAPDSYTPTTLAPTNSSSRTTVLGTGTTVAVTNNGTVPVYVAVGGSSVTATTGSTPILPGNTASFYYAAGSAYVAAITASGTGSLSVQSGTGTPTGFTTTDLSQPSSVLAGLTSAGYVGVPTSEATAAINVSTATTTKIITNSSGKKTYVTAWDIVAGGTGNVTWEYGTGTNCGTGTTVLTGAYNLTAQAGVAKGSGLGAVLVVPASQDVCLLTSAAVQVSGSASYAQF